MDQAIFVQPLVVSFCQIRLTYKNTAAWPILLCAFATCACACVGIHMCRDAAACQNSVALSKTQLCGKGCGTILCACNLPPSALHSVNAGEATLAVSRMQLQVDSFLYFALDFRNRPLCPATSCSVFAARTLLADLPSSCHACCFGEQNLRMSTVRRNATQSFCNAV
jgi:hypothetical protein